MNATNRREVLRFGSASLALPLLVALEADCMAEDAVSKDDEETKDQNPKKVQYLEIVTPEVDAVCETYEQLHGVKFGEAVMTLGSARTAKLAHGGLLAVRGPLRPTEEPVVRPYFLVEDIQEAVSKAAASGGKIALPPMPLPGHGTCAIFIQGGIEHALWQAP